MSGPERPIWFAGDLSDPMASAIVATLTAARPRVIPCPEDLPGRWPASSSRAPRVVIVHRAILGATDEGRLAQLRQRLGPERSIILCVGPHARYADIERWGRLVDVVLPEALAAETIARHVGIDESAGRAAVAAGRRVAVVSTSPELRATWGAILRASGYDALELVQAEAVPPGLAAVWDVPILEPTWATRLGARANAGPTIAAIGFLDRATRAQARQAGAVACLDLPAELADLVRAVDRATGSRRDPAHAAIPRPNLATEETRLEAGSARQKRAT